MQSLRNRQWVDYTRLNTVKLPRHKFHDSDSEDDIITGEHELVEDDNDYLEVDPEEEDDILEDGEIEDTNEEEDKLQLQIQKLAEEGNIGKLKDILQASKQKQSYKEKQ